MKGCLSSSNTAPCSDGSACTVNDACKSGLCSPGAPKSCDDKNPCTTDSCDAKTGCVNANSSDPCDDGNVCTVGDECAAAKCVAGAAANCNDGKPCTDDACDPSKGCLHANNTAKCDDNNSCTVGDTCNDGVCTPKGPSDCDDNNLCTTESCDAKAGCKSVHNTATCSDNSVCTEKDVCSGGKCLPGTPANCGDGNPCTDDSCDPQKGCMNLANSATCTDGNACSTDDTCAKAICVPGAAKNCDDSNPCTADGCDAKSGCSNTDNTAPCTDDNLCTTGDLCAKGACKPGAPKSCDDSNPCTDDSCDAASGCANTANTLGCDDGNACTVKDLCADAKCVPGKPLSCDDGNACTDDACKAIGGCLHADNTADCSDGSVCTEGDACAGGTCKAGKSASCSDGNVCTDDSCDATKGCTYADNTASCNDDNGCTASDVCSAGKCVGQAGCASNAVCSPSGQSTACKCKGGYSGDGFTCSDVNECTAGTFTCPNNTGCKNTIGSYDCACNTNFEDCNNSMADGCEVDLLQDAGHCGACTTKCSNNGIASPTCSAGVCDGACDAGLSDCNNDKKTDGCEVKVKGADAANCGGCGTVCSSNNITKKCTAGVCDGACASGYFDCNNNKQTDGCEVSTNFDAKNCGGCGIVCGSGKCGSGNCLDRVLVVATGGDVGPITSTIASQPFAGFAKIDGFNASYGTPSLAQLKGYDVVLVVSNYNFNDAKTLGDNAADYVDQGGRVVLAVFTNASVGMQGRWANGYNVIMPWGQLNNSYVGSISSVTGHPLTAGVNSLSSSCYRSTGSVGSGTYTMATWSDGRPAIVYGKKNSGMLVSLNFFPVQGYNCVGGDWIRALTNALTFKG